MIQRIVVLIGGLVLLLGGGSYLMKDKAEYKAPATQSVSASSWIEVVNPNIFVLRSDGSNEKELHTGDEVLVGSTLKSSASGRATIHLPDGSAIRLDSDSTVTIDKVDFNPTDESITVRISLLSGRVWSKVVALVTPESSWEVKTTSAVATVRGTAFSVGYRNGKSRVIGAEHNILVRPIDPKTRKVIESAKIEVKENTFVEFADTDVTELASATTSALTAPFSIKQTTKVLKEEAWFKESREEDKKIDDKIEVMKKEGFDEKRQREELRKEDSLLKEKADGMRKENKDDKEIIKEIRKDKIELFKARLEESIKTEETTDKNVETTPVETKEVPASGTIRPESSFPVKLLIVSKITPTVVDDGTKVSFSAMIVMSDNTKKDVTAKAEWKVIGNFGNFDLPGIFTAKIRDEDSELGDIKGGVTAVYSEGGQTFKAPEIDFVVTPSVEETTPQG